MNNFDFQFVDTNDSDGFQKCWQWKVVVIFHSIFKKSLFFCEQNFSYLLLI